MAEKAAAAAGSGSGTGVTAVVAALLANLGIAVAKFVGFLITGASSMLAEAFHSVAELGLSMALVGVGLAAVTGDPLYDTLGTLAIGVLLAVVAIVLGIAMYSLLLGEAASPQEQAAIRDTIASTPGSRA